jgi:N-acylethanolamine-hydrolysing acid amidase
MSKALAFLALLLALATSTVIPRVGPIETHLALTYKVQIDDPPLKRWAPIMKDFKTKVARFVEFLDLLPIPKGFYDGVEWYAKNEFKHQDFVAEVDAVAQLSGLPFEKMMFLNLLYEFTTVPACTGILVRNSEGKILHGRNWDFEMFELLGSMVAKVEYYRGDKLLFSEDTVAGSVFSITGLKPGAFGISVNARHPHEQY